MSLHLQYVLNKHAERTNNFLLMAGIYHMTHGLFWDATSSSVVNNSVQSMRKRARINSPIGRVEPFSRPFNWITSIRITIIMRKIVLCHMGTRFVTFTIAYKNTAPLLAQYLLRIESPGVRLCCAQTRENIIFTISAHAGTHACP